MLKGINWEVVPWWVAAPLLVGGVVGYFWWEARKERKSLERYAREKREAGGKEENHPP